MGLGLAEKKEFQSIKANPSALRGHEDSGKEMSLSLDWLPLLLPQMTRERGQQEDYRDTGR